MKKVPGQQPTKYRLIRHVTSSFFTFGIFKQWAVVYNSTGVTQREAEDALICVEYWYEYYLRYDFTPAEAYYKVVLGFLDAFFDCYTFPKVSFDLYIATW